MALATCFFAYMMMARQGGSQRIKPPTSKIAVVGGILNIRRTILKVEVYGYPSKAPGPMSMGDPVDKGTYQNGSTDYEKHFPHGRPPNDLRNPG